MVRNYGVSGRTLPKKGDYPYWKEAAYNQSRNWGPDVVIIRLGTNDSKPALVRVRPRRTLCSE